MFAILAVPPALPLATVVHFNPDAVPESVERYNPFAPAVNLTTVSSALPTIKSPLASTVDFGTAAFAVV